MAPVLPELIQHGWANAGEGQKVSSCREISAAVSTNRVYELTLENGQQRIAKLSSYGNYPQFCQDHHLIQQWAHQLQSTRYRNFLAKMVEREGQPFCYRQDNEWLVFYEKVPFYDFLPARLDHSQVLSLGQELAQFHEASARAACALTPSWKSVGADIGALHSAAGDSTWLAQRGFGSSEERCIRTHCETFLRNAERLGYHQMKRIPLLVDWNTGNFSVGFEEQGFQLYSRWDYDWFRVEPRTLDFYFCARVVRDEGDQESFSYLVDPLLEARFVDFLVAYSTVNPLPETELLFLKEAYRFFILNYVLRHGEHFFRPQLRSRLQKEAIEVYLPRLDTIDFHSLVEAVAQKGSLA